MLPNLFVAGCSGSNDGSDPSQGGSTPPPAAPSPSAGDAPCVKCDGAGWLWRHQLDNPGDWRGEADDTRYTCDACGAKPALKLLRAEPAPPAQPEPARCTCVVFDDGLADTMPCRLHDPVVSATDVCLAPTRPELCPGCEAFEGCLNPLNCRGARSWWEAGHAAAQVELARVRAELAEMRAELAKLQDRLVLAKAEGAALGSVLLDTQQDCIAERSKRVEAEGRVAGLCKAVDAAHVMYDRQRVDAVLAVMTVEDWKRVLAARAALATEPERGGGDGDG